MTEAGWMACTDPRPMLEFLHGKASDRKLRLFAAACCRRIWWLMTDREVRRAVEAAEEYADGAITENRLERARTAANERAVKNQPDAWSSAEDASSYFVALAAQCAARWGHLSYAAADAARYVTRARNAVEGIDEAGSQTRLLREVIGNPFRPVATASAWRTPGVMGLAQAIYDGRAFDRLPELAEALRGAGCDEAELLAHCRDPGPHVRGCWAVDNILEKS